MPSSRNLFHNVVVYLSLLFLSFLLSTCSSHLVLDDLPSTFRQLNIESLPGQGDYPDADAVVVLDLTDNRVVVENRSLVTYETRHVIKKIFRNTNEQSTITMFVFPDEQLQDIKARTIRPDRRTVDLQPSDFYTVSGMGASSILYADIKTIRFTFPAVEKDCIVEYAFVKRKDEPFVRDVWRIQNDIPTIRNQYSLSVPKLMAFLLPYRYRACPDTQQIKPIVDTNKIKSAGLSDPVTFTWTRADVPAFKPEDLMPPQEMFRAQIRFARAEWGGWSGMASWYAKNFFRPRLIITDSIRILAQKLTASKSQPEDKVRSIYSFVQQIRYVAIQLGQSGLEPSLPQTVLARRYGDCKDKSILCIALLNAAGIEASPVLVLSSTSGVLDPTFPSWHFDHMIVKARVDVNRAYWLDPTSEYTPFGSLPWEDQVNPVLTLTSDGGGKIEMIPKPRYSENLLNYRVHMNVLESGQANVITRLTCVGEEARHFRALLAEKSKTEIIDLCRGVLLNELARAEIDTTWVENLGELDSTLTLNLNFHVPHALQQQGDLFYVNPGIFKEASNLQWTAKETRKYPIWFPTGFAVQRTTTVHICDSSLVLLSFPKTVSFQSTDFSYANTVESNNPMVVKSVEMFLLNRSTFPPGRYKELKEFFQNVKTSMDRSIFLKRKGT
jgi:transglutaminase-like putative cysteine protease